MSRDDTLARLAALQARFSAVLRTPLDPGSGTLRADLDRYAREACDDVVAGRSLAAAERLAVYNRQYWMRLLRLLQHELPLTSRLLGPWLFNQHATRFLLAQPPSGHDLARVADGFEPFLGQDVAGEFVELGRGLRALPRAALLEAARIDAAFRRVFFAPEQPRFEVTQDRARELACARLRFSAAYARVEEHWPLVKLRKSLLGTTGERPVPLPAPLARPQHWALVRNEQGVGHAPLEPGHARLLELLETHAVQDALGRLEHECPPEQRDALAERAQRWLAQSVASGFFSGFEP